MDVELESRWREGRRPFDGVCLHSAAMAPLGILRESLVRIVDVLGSLYPTSRLLTLHDWHEHDGVVLPSRETTWAILRETLSSDDQLYRSMAGDTYVRIAIFPEDRSFYLRYYIPEECDDLAYPERSGDFDLTLSEDEARDVACALGEVRSLVVEQENAKVFFDSRYGG